MADLTTGEIEDALAGTPWRVVLGRLRAHFRTPDFVSALAFVQRVADEAELAGHHPDVELQHGYVALSLVSHDVARLTDRDVLLARRVAQVAVELGVEQAPGAPQAVEIAVDTTDDSRIRPFWAAVLGYDAAPDDEDALADPHGLGPQVWFQEADAARSGRGRLHVDVSVAVDEGPGRVEAALAAGGTLVTDEHAPSWWVLADADGNEVCVSTAAGRD